MATNVAAFILMLIIVPLAGELKFYPFQDDFRVSLGTAFFFFFLLWIQRIPPVLSGLVVGLHVVALRVAVDYIWLTDVSIEALVRLHYPALFYYLAYAGLFQLFKLNQLPYRPLRVGVLSVFIEFISNVAELAFRHSIALNTIDWYDCGKLILIAVIRSFFVLGFFNIIQLRQSHIKEEQQRREKERILLLVSNLYEESIQLKKTLQCSEDITRDCYELYRGLQNVESLQGSADFAQHALRISGQVHEIKKDNQRILAGLSKLIDDQSSSDDMNPAETVRLIVRTNQKYASSLGKEIQFRLEMEEQLPPMHAYTLLSLINNLVANAVEAILDNGTITIGIRRLNASLDIRVGDDGPGIPPRKRKVIFTPGYTTKYDSEGKPSTGIGLHYVKDVVEARGGRFELLDETESGAGETVFIIQLPIDELTRKG